MYCYYIHFRFHSLYKSLNICDTWTLFEKLVLTNKLCVVLDIYLQETVYLAAYCTVHY